MVIHVTIPITFFVILLSIGHVYRELARFG